MPGGVQCYIPRDRSERAEAGKITRLTEPRGAHYYQGKCPLNRFDIPIAMINSPPNEFRQ